MTEYEVELSMDDRCQIRQHHDFIVALDCECGINTDYDEQVTADFEGGFILHDLDDEQMYHLLELLKDCRWRRDVTLSSVTTNDGREWYPSYANGPFRTADWVLYGADGGVYAIQKGDESKEAIWARFIEALKEDD